MKISAKKIVISSVIVLLLTGGVFYAVYRSNNENSRAGTEGIPQKINYDPPTEDQVDAGVEIKEQATSDTPQPNSNSFEVIVSAANQNNPNLQIRALIQAVLSQDATCKLTLSKGQRTVIKSANVQPLANSSTCKGFDVPLSELEPGTWSLQILVASGERSGTVQREVQIQ